MSSTLYFSGIEKAATANVLVQQHAAGMISQLQYSPELLLACHDIKLVMDSGAYSRVLTHKDIERYARIIITLGDRCEWYTSPDCIGDQAQSEKNYCYLLSLLPHELHHKILWVYQYSAGDMSLLDQTLDHFPRIGIGGLKPLFEKCPSDVACQKVAVLAQRIARTSRCIPHYFAVTRLCMIERLAAIHEEYTVDSTTWLVGSKYGMRINARGQQVPARGSGNDCSSEELLAQNVRTMRKWVECAPVQKSPSSHLLIQQLAIF